MIKHSKQEFQSLYLQRNPVRSLPNCFNTSQPYNVYLREFSASIIVISFANNKTLSTMGIYFYVGKYRCKKLAIFSGRQAVRLSLIFEWY